MKKLHNIERDGNKITVSK